MKEQNRQIYRFDNFQLDAGNRQLRRDDKPLSLPPKAFDLLLALVENKGRLVEKDELFTSVWQDQIVEESNLTVHISQIRKALGETKNNPRYIVTVPGYGYRFVGDVSEDEELVIETQTLSRITIEKEDEITGDNGAKSKPSAVVSGFLEEKKTISLSKKIAVALAVLLVVAGFWGFVKMRGGFFSASAIEKQPEIKRLTYKGRVNKAVISPDGRFFVYTLTEPGSYQTEMRLGQTDGGSDVLLRPFAGFFYLPTTFSADRSWLYYTASIPREKNGTLYKMPVLGGVSQKLAENISIYSVLSPDEKRLAFVRNNRENKTSSLFVADADGANEREIAVRPSNRFFEQSNLSWSADGQLIALGAANGERKSNASNKSYEIFTVRLADGNINQLTALDWNEISHLEWLKDDSGLGAIAQSKDKFYGMQLWLIDYPGGAARKISRDVNSYASVVGVSADSKTLITLQSQYESNIWVAPTENLAAARQITFGTPGRSDGWFGMDWTADGRLVYTAWIDESLTLWAMDADGANARQLTSIGFRDERPTATADGRFFVFQSNRSGKTEIWRVDVDGGNLTQITDDGGNSSPSVTPDGNWVVYRHNENEENSLRRVSLNGGETVLITAADSRIPHVSPDGKLVACIAVIDEKNKLAVFSIEGGEPIAVFDVPKTQNARYGLRWSPDGQFISYPDEANAVWRQNLAGGAPERLEGLPVEKIFSFGWSPDGKQFAFGRAREVRDAVLISDFR